MRKYEFFTAPNLREAQQRTNDLAEDGWQLKSVDLVQEQMGNGFRTFWVVVMEQKMQHQVAKI